jgi:hypothetical protein
MLSGCLASLSKRLWPLSPAFRRAAGRPDIYDLHDANVNYITSVENQDDPVECNACTAFAVVATVEGTFNKKNRLTGNPATLGPDLDEMELFTKPAPPLGGCKTSHWWPKHALARGLVLGLAWEGDPAKPRIELKNFVSLLEPSLRQTQDRMKDWIFNRGPVAAVMLQYRDFYDWGKYWQTNHAGQSNVSHVYFPGAPMPGSGAPVDPDKPGDPGPIVGGHVVSIVGYNDTSSIPFWICKNSWGKEWNGDGYILIAQGRSGHPAIPKCFIDSIDVYGVIVK